MFTLLPVVVLTGFGTLVGGGTGDAGAGAGIDAPGGIPTAPPCINSFNQYSGGIGDDGATGGIVGLPSGTPDKSVRVGAGCAGGVPGCTGDGPLGGTPCVVALPSVTFGMTGCCGRAIVPPPAPLVLPALNCCGGTLTGASTGVSAGMLNGFSCGGAFGRDCCAVGTDCVGAPIGLLFHGDCCVRDCGVPNGLIPGSPVGGIGDLPAGARRGCDTFGLPPAPVAGCVHGLGCADGCGAPVRMFGGGVVGGAEPGGGAFSMIARAIPGRLRINNDGMDAVPASPPAMLPAVCISSFAKYPGAVSVFHIASGEVRDA